MHQHLASQFLDDPLPHGAVFPGRGNIIPAAPPLSIHPAPGGGGLARRTIDVVSTTKAIQRTRRDQHRPPATAFVAAGAADPRIDHVLVVPQAAQVKNDVVAFPSNCFSRGDDPRPPRSCLLAARARGPHSSFLARPSAEDPALRQLQQNSLEKKLQDSSRHALVERSARGAYEDYNHELDPDDPDDPETGLNLPTGGHRYLKKFVLPSCPGLALLGKK